MVASEEENVLMSFAAELGNIMCYGPDIPILPRLQTIVLTGAPARDEVVSYGENDLEINGETIPSLEKIMSDRDISYELAKQEKTVGRMIVPDIANYLTEPELTPVEIIEITYREVDDVWGAIDEYGRLLSEDYDFHVSYAPTPYPDMGEDYRFCELLSYQDEGTVYVACIYSRDEQKIFLQFGIVWSQVQRAGIGPINLERIRSGGVE
jgi:hypothetical protein